MEDTERRLLIRLLTKEEKEFTDTAAAMCRIRTAIAQGAREGDLPFDDCRLLASILGANVEEYMAERHRADGSLQLQGIPALKELGELSILAFKWVGIAHLKNPEGKGGGGV